MASQRPTTGRRGRPPYPDILTPAEWRVLDLLREGLSNPEIAERLALSRDTVKTHVAAILAKLGVPSREEAAAWEPEAAREPQLRRWGSGLVGWLRPVTLGKAALVGASVVVLAGMGVLAWGVLRTSGGEEASSLMAESPSASVSPITSPPSATPLAETTPRPELPPSRSLTFQPSQSGRYFRGLYERSGDGVITLLAENPDLAVGGAFSVSHDGQWLAFVYESTVYVHRRGGDERSLPVASFEHVWGIALSPDGSRAIVYARGSEGNEGHFMVDMRSGSYELFQPGGYQLFSPVWSPDGAWIAFYDGTCNDQGSYLVASDGSGLRKLADYRGELAWSPDGRRIALTAHCAEGVWLADVDGGISQLSLSDPTFGSPSWSPDGRLLSFATTEGEVRVIDTANRQEWRVTDGGNPTWSPDGLSLAFVREKNLYVASVDGSTESQIAFPTQPSIAGPIWLSDGSLVFAFAPPFTSSIYVRDIASGSEMNLADGYAPFWSPDGKSIAFVGSGTGGGVGGTNEIDTMSSDGSDIRPVARYDWSDVVSCLGRLRIAWSPDGRYLAYRDASAALTVISMDSSPVPGYNASGCRFSWSPDGVRLTQSASAGLAGAGIAVTDFDSGNRYVLATADGEIAWSPDGTRIAFTRDDSFYVIGVDGTRERQLVSSRVSEAYSLSWSPDSRSLLATSGRALGDEFGTIESVVMVIDAATGEARDIAPAYSPTWSPDGRTIAFVAGSPPIVYLVDANGGQPAVVAKGSEVAWSPDGTRILLTRPVP